MSRIWKSIITLERHQPEGWWTALVMPALQIKEVIVGKWVNETRRGEIVASVLKAGKFKISVHRHIHHPPDTWLLDCYGLFDCKELASKDLEEAKCQAAALVQVELENAVRVIISA